ncbi:methyltransferase domain-containing protein [Candidatus Woesebacteria bacterium]|nr:methyltransferase domain-containing protein [Candidatus Woesebacteria bacterium]
MPVDFNNIFNEKYKTSPKLFGKEPVPVVKRALTYIDKGKALELGVGNGRNTLYLLENSFKVTGVDMSEEGIKILKERAGGNQSLKLVVSNVLEFETTEKFDLVLAIGLLHFLKKDKINFLVKKMKNWTARGGYNVVATRMVQNLRQNLPHIFSPNELKKCYEDDDWQIEEYEEIERGERKIASLIARKP